MKKVKGIYKDNIIKLLEDVDAQDGTEVEVLFSNASKDKALGASPNLHLEIKELLVKEIPQLKEMSKEELKKDFDKLSQKIAQALPYKNWKEAERVMKGLDRHDPRRLN